MKKKEGVKRSITVLFSEDGFLEWFSRGRPLWIIILLLAACNSGNHSDKLKGDIRHVIVIGIDGMSVFGVRNARTPTLDRLMKEGSYTLRARGVLPTSSSSNWASMISGAGPEQHGVTSNDWERDAFILPAVTEGEESIFPTIFSVVKKAHPERISGAVYQWGGFGRLVEKSFVDFDRATKDEWETAEIAEKFIKEQHPVFTFIHFDHVDHAGHHDGHKTEKYLEAVTVADSLIGRIIESVKESGMIDNTLVIVSSDHGGIGYGHGGETPDEIEIPFIVWGKGIKKGHEIKHTVFTYDIAATVAFALGIDLPYEWIGRPVKSAFTGHPEPDIIQSKNYLAGPSIYPLPRLYEPAGGLYIDTTALVKIESREDGAKIVYTLDGTDPGENSTVYKEPFMLEQSTVVSAIVIKEHLQSKIERGYYRVASSGDKNGVHYRYYEGEGWKRLPLFDALEPIKSGKTYEIRINDIPARDEQFAILYNGYLQIDSKENIPTTSPPMTEVSYLLTVR